MTDTLNVETTRNDLVVLMHTFGFHPADADPTDFRHPDNMYRFKIGTSRGEVAVIAFLGQMQHKALRVISHRTHNEAVDEIIELIKRGKKS